MTFMNFFSPLTILTTILFLDSTTSLEFPPEFFNVIYPNFVSNARHPTSNRHRGSYSHALSPALARSPSPMNPANSPSPVSPARSPSPVAPARSPPPLAPARSPSSMGPARSPSSMGPATSPSPVIPARLTYPLAPALFVIGDSSVDCGTNNFLGTFARADRPPYGRDFDSHQPTGRFSNGRIPVDYLALRLGLPFVPSYLGQTGSVMDMIRGVNYASAGAGIIFSSGSELGQHISLSQQIQQVMDTFQQFTLSLGVRAANNLMSTSIFYISIGSNDYIHYYLRNVSNVQSLYLPWNFNQFLAQTMKQQIENLYNANVRNIVVMGLAPLGCAPYYLWLYGSQNGECIEIINNMVLEFNFVMRYMVDEFNHEFRDSNIVFCDAFEGSMDIIQNHDYYGFNVTADACCGLGRYNGWMMCISSDMACSNASNHIWWDQFHPTAAVNGILADSVWSGLHVNMCYPMNLQDMISQKDEKNVRKHRYSEY